MTPDSVYDPIAGDPSDAGRVEVFTPVPGLLRARVPVSMTEDDGYVAARANPLEWERLRCRHDFEFWAARCVTVRHKILGEDVRLVLNRPQRRVARLFEARRRAGLPVRVIMLKARQWGGSTLVQTYMAWIQLCLRRNWHSIICSQVKDTSSGIRGMYSKLLENYPEDLWEGDSRPAFRPYERSGNVRVIEGRGCRVTVSSIENQDAVRGADFAMAHLSEVAYWRATPGHCPEDVIRAICGSVPAVDGSFIAMESTANGVGNFFHREWLRSQGGAGSRLAVFVPWHEIDYYRLPVEDTAAVMDSLDDYEKELVAAGCDAGQIAWYRFKLAEMGSREKMMAEFPSTPAEAFIATGSGVFDRAAVEALRAGCDLAPARGDVVQGRWISGGAGAILMWEAPAPDAVYVAAVDIGGSTPRADFSVITVMVAADRPRVVAQWRGHCAHDVLARRAMDIGALYGDALLVVESNSLEGGAGAGFGMYVLDLMAGYPNLYRRRVYDDAARSESTRIGFHTNRSTKEMLVGAMIAAVRDGAYVERDPDACDELMVYERRSDGSYGARDGCHDDIVMSRALALHAVARLAPARAECDPAELFRPYW